MRPSFQGVRRHPILTGLCIFLLLLMVLIAIFDWNWLRPPLERYISAKTQRTFKIDDLDVRLGFTPTIRMRNLSFSNSPGSKEPLMARAETVEFSVSLRDLPDKILVPRVALTKPDLVFEKFADERRNWVLSEPSESDSPSKLRISTLSVDQGRLRYFDHGEPFELEVNASTFDPSKQDKVKDADAAPQNDRYSTRYAFKGTYHDANFSGTALTGEVLSFQESGVPFPLKGDLQAGTTRVRVEGTR
jgi:AsmA protein